MGSASSCCRDLFPTWRGRLEGTEIEPLIHEDFRVQPLPQGSIVNIYKQDPTSRTPGLRKVWLPVDIKPGPASKDVVVKGLSHPVAPSDDLNNYDYNPDTHAEDFDGVMPFSVVTMILTMYRRALTRMGVTKELTWQWGTQPITIEPRFGEEMNALYSRDDRRLEFYYFKSLTGNQTIYTCRSFDIVSHETGHAILDSLKPSLNNIGSLYPQAVHESFADLTTILSLLYQPDMCDAILTACRGNLHNKSFLSALAEEMGDGLGMGYGGIRNSDNNMALDEVEAQSHALSVVMTGAVYDIIADMYDMTLDLERYHPAETLYRLGQHVTSLLVIAITRAPAAPTFRDIAEAMMEVETQAHFRAAIKKQFERRKVFDDSARPIAQPVRRRVDGADRRRRTFICGYIKEEAIIEETVQETMKEAPGGSTIDAMDYLVEPMEPEGVTEQHHALSDVKVSFADDIKEEAKGHENQEPKQGSLTKNETNKGNIISTGDHAAADVKDKSSDTDKDSKEDGKEATSTPDNTAGDGTHQKDNVRLLEED